MNHKWIVVPIAVAVIGCSPDPGSSEKSAVQEGQTNSIAHGMPAVAEGGSTSSKASSQKVNQAIRNIRSYLVDLEGGLRVGPAGTWEMKASAARHIVGNMRLDVDTLARAGLNVGGLRSSLLNVTGSLANASEANWNNLVTSGHNDIGAIRSALAELEQEK